MRTTPILQAERTARYLKLNGSSGKSGLMALAMSAVASADSEGSTEIMSHPKPCAVDITRRRAGGTCTTIGGPCEVLGRHRPLDDGWRQCELRVIILVARRTIHRLSGVVPPEHMRELPGLSPEVVRRCLMRPDETASQLMSECQGGVYQKYNCWRFRHCDVQGRIGPSARNETVAAVP